MKRVLTASATIAFALLVTIYAPGWLFALVAGVVAAVMLDEYLNLFAAMRLPKPGRWILPIAVLVTWSFSLESSLAVVDTTLLTVAALSGLTIAAFRQNIDDALVSVAPGLSGLIYCCILFSFLIRIRETPGIQGSAWLVILFVVIGLGDAGAYYGGRAFGRHPLAPRISPKKTIEGAVAGLLTSVAVGIALGLWLVKASWPWLALISAAAAIAGQIGDLAESALKRSAGVKDSSSILPGHGGVLDRLDSLLFAAPVFYWLIRP